MGAEAGAGARLSTAEDLVVLRRADEAILLSGAAFAPLHVRRGAELVIRAARLETDPAEHPALVELLLDHGVLHRAGREEPGPPPALPERAGAARRMSLYLLVTHGCNLACAYCFNGDETYRRAEPPAMSEAVAAAALRWAARRLAPEGELEVVFFGGEPLLRWPLVRWTVDHARAELAPLRPDVRLRYHLTSNLTRCPDGLVELARAVGMTFLCNVDGPPEVHDRLRPRAGGGPSHAATARTIARLRGAGLEVALRATVTRQTVCDLPGLVAHHAELGGASSALVPLNPVSSDQRPVDAALLAPPSDLARGLAEAFEAGLYPAERLHPWSEAVGRFRARERRRVACGAPFGCTPVVDAGGDLYPCIYFVGIPALRMGNVLAPDEGDRASEVLAALLGRLDVDATEPCARCGLRYVCAGGCPAMRVLTWDRGDLAPMAAYARESSCAVARTVTETLLWREAACA